MLRNASVIVWNLHTTYFLNEVLSLNAQELRHVTYSVPTASLLNEVLSLNAQESAPQIWQFTCSLSSMKS